MATFTLGSVLDKESLIRFTSEGSVHIKESGAVSIKLHAIQDAVNTTIGQVLRPGVLKQVLQQVATVKSARWKNEGEQTLKVSITAVPPRDAVYTGTNIDFIKVVDFVHPILAPLEVPNSFVAASSIKKRETRKRCKIETVVKSPPFKADQVVDDNCKMLSGMNKVLSFNLQEAKGWLDDYVQVYHQVVVHRVDGGVQVAFDEDAIRNVERIQFLKATIVWYANKVLGKQIAIYLSSEEMLFVDDDAVVSALNALEEAIQTVEEFDDMFYTYLFGANGFVDGKKDAGFYAKDLDVSGMHKQRLLDSFDKSGMYTEAFVKYIKDDQLHVIAPGSSGLDFFKSWMYNGGIGLAGWHAEDAGMHFGHQSIALEMTLDDALVSRVLNWYMKFSRKTWVMYKHMGADGMIRLNNLLASRFGVPQCTDELLLSRSYLLDPRTLGGSNDFEVVYQHPGQLFMSVYPHQVFGLNLWSFAWNYCFHDKLDYYLEVEADLAENVRNVGRFRDTGSRSLVLTSKLVHAFMFEGLSDEMKIPLMSSARAAMSAERSQRAPKISGGLVGFEVGIPRTPEEAQCSICQGPILDRLFMVKEVKYCIKCACKNRGNYHYGQLLAFVAVTRSKLFS